MINNQPKDKTIKIKSLGEVVADEIRRRIWAKEIHFGDRLIEADLSTQMGISRSSLRDAFQILEHEGLVDNVARKGTFIREFTKKDLDEIKEVRMLIEVPAIVQTVSRITEKDYEHLERILELMKMEIKEENWFELFDLDTEFHHYLINICSNSRIHAIYDVIVVQIRTFLSLLSDYYLDRKEIFYEEHRELLDAIRTGDKEFVEKIAIQHIMHVELQ